VDAGLEFESSSIEMAACICPTRLRWAGMSVKDNIESTRFLQYDRESP
jgi:hypothetical protein